MRAVNLDTYSLSLLTAKEDILNPRSSTNWALFTYDGLTNNLKLTDSGAGGLVELAGKFHAAKPQYGLCRAASSKSGTPVVALISWVGKDVDEFRRTECATHVPSIRNFFKEAQVFLSADVTEDVTEEKISTELSKVQPPAERARRSSRSVDKEETVGTNYRKTNAALEMRRINRDSFWARAEREEEQRKEEERRRAGEERRRLERERVTKERLEAEERERKMDEKLQMIEEQRRRQAELEEGMRKQEKARWETQQREHEEDMRARLRHSESIEKAAEAAVLVSQRSINPREFFRQLSSNSAQSPSSPSSPRSGKPPLRRYQRSLTDSGYAFGRSDGSLPTSPRSPTLVSPFFRAPPSPLLRPISPASYNFHPITSPVRPRAPVRSPPTSPLCPTPPVSTLPTLPLAKSSSQPSAPPASPGFLSALSASAPPDRPPQAMPPTPPDRPPLAMPPTPPDSPLQNQEQAPALTPDPQGSQTHLQPQLSSTCPVSVEITSETISQDTEQYTATYVHAELSLEAGYIAQAVLVEEEPCEGRSLFRHSDTWNDTYEGGGHSPKG
ncbi:drebrin [Aplochiton taeniatus]